MKPETEHIARELASLVLRDNGRHPYPEAACGDVRVDVEMGGMVRKIRQSLMLDAVATAAMVADQIERKTAEVNIEALVAKAVADTVASMQYDIADRVSAAVERAVDAEIGRQIGSVKEWARASVSAGVALMRKEGRLP